MPRVGPQSRSVMIAGATGELGQIIAATMAQDIASIALVGRQDRKLQSVQQKISMLCKTRCYRIPSSPDYRLVNRIVKSWFSEPSNSASLIYCIGDNIPTPFFSTSTTRWKVTINTNLTLAFYFMKAFVKCCDAIDFSNKPVICVMASTAGLRGFPNSTAYCASKHGLIGLVRSVASEYKTKMKIYALSPGLVETKSLARNIRRQSATTGESPASIMNRLRHNGEESLFTSKEEIAVRIRELILGQSFYESGAVITF